MANGPSDKQIKEGLNKHGLFFEELVYQKLLEPGQRGRFAAVKEEVPYSYQTVVGTQNESGTIDFVGYYASSGTGQIPTIFSIECKKVNTAKKWLFAKMKHDQYETSVDSPNYIMRLQNLGAKTPKRLAAKAKPIYEGLTIKALEIMESGKVMSSGNSLEKVFNACRQAVRANNGLFSSQQQIGMAAFNRDNYTDQINYVPLVITNAELAVFDIDAENVSEINGELSTESNFKTQQAQYVYYAYSLSAEERQTLSIIQPNGSPISDMPSRIIVPIVNIKYLDDFLVSFRNYAQED